MADFKLSASKTLKRLKACLDRNEKGATGLSINLADDLATDKVKSLLFTVLEANVMKEVAYDLYKNQGFEYLNFEMNNLIRDLACRYVLTKDGELFAKFLDDHFKEPENLRVFIPIEGLQAKEPVVIQQVTLRPFPIDGLDINENGYFEGIKTVAEVRVSGTDPGLMRDRALSIVGYELKLLRVGLRAEKQMHDQQLRFRAGRGWAIENGRIGWTEHSDTGYALGINNELLGTVTEQPLYKIPLNPTNKIDRKMKLAIEWLDQSRLATDPLMRVLYDMFALETILGDKSAGKKARLLAFRRALLSTIINGHYPDPNITLNLYEQVRSYAVHGGEVDEYEEKDAKSLSWSVRLALNEYLQIVNDQGFTKPRQVFDYLDNHPEHDKLLNWLVELDPAWNELAKA